MGHGIVDWIKRLCNGAHGPLLAVGAIGFIVAAGVHVWRNKVFDPQAFGIGFGAILAGGGAGMGMRHKADTDEQK